MPLTINLTDVVGSSGDIGYIPYIVANDKLGNSYLREVSNGIVNDSNYTSADTKSFVNVYNGGVQIGNTNGLSALIETDATQTRLYNEITKVASVTLNDTSTAVVHTDLINLTAPSITLDGTLNEDKGADIASAGTTNIAAATGNYVVITGTTTITAFGTAQAGARRILRFDGALTLTHNATSLILPGAANITTAQGDVGTFISLGSGNWRCISYTKASGLGIVDTFTIPFEALTHNPADSTTYYVGFNLGISPQTTATNVSFNIGYSFVITGANVFMSGNTTAGSTENNVLQLRNVTQGTSSNIGNFLSNGSASSSANTSFTGLNISVASGDSVAIQWDAPAYATNPIAVRMTGWLTCKRV